MKLLQYEDLKLEKGVPYSKTQIWRLEKLGEFPRRVPLAGKANGRHGWVEEEIDDWIRKRIAQRDRLSGGNGSK